jgi:hypothetical protein
MFKMKKKINWKKFTKMYNDLGQYRIVDRMYKNYRFIDLDKFEYFDSFGRSGYWHTMESVICNDSYDKDNTVKRFTKLIAELRYRKIRNKRTKEYDKNGNKILYKNP